MKPCLAIPIFDHGESIGKVVESLASLDLPCIIVDDGSRDDSPALLRRCADSDARFRVVSTPHRGLVAALNTGLAQCRGEFVARMDADDVMTSPHVLIGSSEQIEDTILRRREEFGFTYVTFSSDAVETMAPIVNRLAGT